MVVTSSEIALCLSDPFYLHCGQFFPLLFKQGGEACCSGQKMRQLSWGFVFKLLKQCSLFCVLIAIPTFHVLFCLDQNFWWLNENKTRNTLIAMRTRNRDQPFRKLSVFLAKISKFFQKGGNAAWQHSPPWAKAKKQHSPPSSGGGMLLWSKNEIAILRNFFQLARNRFSFEIFENVARSPKS